ncbi:uncharacterized protein LOC143601720 [Bidens hawaiensis]|uniref:uncharacterized protein LOC143601720 n=1 Tax=Bidens hawaiensis TaxID=980011 RepID=UPI004048F8EC
MGSRDPVRIQTVTPWKMNTHKVKGIFKSLRYFSQAIEDEKKQDIQIGGPTDVKHVAHYGCDGSSEESPSWMRGFGTNPECQSASSGVSKGLSDDPKGGSEDQRMSRKESKEKLKSRHRGHCSVENAPDHDSQTKSRQPRRLHTRGAEDRGAQDESLPEVSKKTRKKKPT